MLKQIYYFVVIFFSLVVVIIYHNFSYKNVNEQQVNRLKNIVIVLGRGYKRKEINIFITTLKKQSPDCSLLLFSNSDLIIFSKNIFHNNGKVVGIEILDNYPYYPSNHSVYPISLDELYKTIPKEIKKTYDFFYHTIRFMLINVWMEKYGELYDNILICDIKDIFFQNDPFAYIKEKGVYLQQEIYIRNNKIGIIADECNYAWIKPYNPSSSILLKPIINSGQILGSSKEVKHFLSEFCSFIYQTQLNTAEQGSMNYFLYSKEHNENFIIKTHGYGFALLLHYSLPRTKDNFTPFNNYLYNFDGSIPPIIHAYHLGLSYGSWNRIKKYREYINFHNKE